MPLLPQPNCQRPTATRLPGRNRGSVLPDGQGTDSGRHSPTTKPNPSPGYLPIRRPLAPGKILNIQLPPRVVKRHLVAKKRLSLENRPPSPRGGPLTQHNGIISVSRRCASQANSENLCRSPSSPHGGAPEPALCHLGSQFPQRRAFPGARLPGPATSAGKLPAIRGDPSCRPAKANRKPLRCPGRGGSSQTRLPNRRFGPRLVQPQAEGVRGITNPPPLLAHASGARSKRESPGAWLTV